MSCFSHLVFTTLSRTDVSSGMRQLGGSGGSLQTCRICAGAPFRLGCRWQWFWECLGWPYTPTLGRPAETWQVRHTTSPNGQPCPAGSSSTQGNVVTACEVADTKAAVLASGGILTVLAVIAPDCRSRAALICTVCHRVVLLLRHRPR